MSEQRQPIVVNTASTESQEELNKKIAERLDKKKNIRALLVERGSTRSALDVDLPSHIHGEWVRNDPLRIAEKRDLGFEIDKEYAPKQAFHNANADGSAVVGDLIFMTCPKEVKEIIDEVRGEEYMRRHGKPGQINPVTKEEREFISSQQTLTGSHIGTSNESAAAPVKLAAGNPNLK